MTEEKRRTAVRKGMQGNKSKNTLPERLVRKVLWEAGFRGYRLHRKDVPGNPDVVFYSRKIAIFINGCFWHRCPHCNPPMPKTNVEFWENKFKNNVERDNRNLKILNESGWRVVVLWECELSRNIGNLIVQLDHWINEYPD